MNDPSLLLHHHWDCHIPWPVLQRFDGSLHSASGQHSGFLLFLVPTQDSWSDPWGTPQLWCSLSSTDSIFSPKALTLRVTLWVTAIFDAYSSSSQSVKLYSIVGNQEILTGKGQLLSLEHPKRFSTLLV